MSEGTRNRWVYLAGFPAVTLLLCGLSYYAGLKRGEQKGMPDVAAPSEGVIPKDHETAGNLTFFKDLKEKEETTINPKPTAPKAPPPVITPVMAEENEAGYVIQISAFKDVGKAHELVDDLKNRGHQAFTSGTGGWHRVYVGPFPDKEKAEASLGPIQKDGYGNGFVTKIDVR